MLNTIHTINLEDQLNELDITKLGEGIYRVGSKSAHYILEVLAVDFDLKTLKVRQDHQVYDIVFKNELDLVLDKMGIKRKVETVNTDVKAPMPGKVIEVIVAVGDRVSKGDGIVILEAMKMENVLKAESDAVIKSILIEEGVSVEKNQLLIELDID
ncbi:acetyl-CoA carboxylase biotin carboxyl carrier protein subunit [Crocinitomix catalasitica]|uniref:acetyl-CoA carboxylase biotin carboxyl carrier protein subunit n=1 Tax=Crocinitomix catalasitica TaxID=184607 RepID=UPI00055B90AA|nr:acetyl-CoA carboxylase biotin carboxyl carrier protein subunit [Crocinitomix catalasitica]